MSVGCAGITTITNAYNYGGVTGRSNAGMVCGFVPAQGTITNCYFLGTAGGFGNNLSSSTVTGKSAEGFASGEVAYLLGVSFGQTLGTDSFPVFRASDDSNAVYKLTYLNGAAEHAAQYYNSGSPVSTTGVPVPTSEDGIFSEWAGIPAIMPAADVTVTAVFDAPVAVEITGFAAIADVDAGTAGSAIYANAAAVQAALPASVTANTSTGTVSVPVNAWADTDGYDPDIAGSYTFTATLGTIPVGYANSGNYTATVEVVVKAAEPAVSTDASLSYLTISDGRLSPSFASETYEYTVDVAYEVTSVNVTPTANNSNPP